MGASTFLLKKNAFQPTWPWNILRIYFDYPGKGRVGRELSKLTESRELMYTARKLYRREALLRIEFFQELKIYSCFNLKIKG